MIPLSWLHRQLRCSSDRLEHSTTAVDGRTNALRGNQRGRSAETVIERRKKRRWPITREVIEWKHGDERRRQEHSNDHRIEKTRRLRLFNFWRRMVAIGLITVLATGHHMSGEVERPVWRQLHPGPGDYRHEQCEGDELYPHPTGSPLLEGGRSPRELLREIHGEDRNTADASHFGQDYTGRGSEISTDHCSCILQSTSKYSQSDGSPCPSLCGHGNRCGR